MGPTRCLQPSRRRGAFPPVAARLLLVAALVAGAAEAQIFKCTDGSGNIVYQNSACPKNTRADRVDIFDNSWTADRVEKDAAWQRQAARHEVVAGMPLRWVREAFGEPAEVRKTATAGAEQVWVYNFPDHTAQVGVLADQVLWFRETPVVAPPARAVADAEPAAAPMAPPPAPPLAALPADAGAAAAPAPPTAAPVSPAAAPAAGVPADPGSPAAPPLPVAPRAPTALATLHEAPDSAPAVPAAPKISESRHGIVRGQDCRQALAELGTPDRTREVPALDNKSDPTTEYFYEPAGSASPTRTRIVCANGKVEGVDHSVLR
jgi:hypothetical protein